MSEEQTVRDGQDENASSERPEQKTGTVSYETHRRLLGQLKNAQARLEELERAQKEREEAFLAEQGKFRELAEARAAELAKIAEENKRLQAEALEAKNNVVKSWKLQSIRERLPGKLRKQEFYRYFDLDAVQMNPETLEVDTKSVDEVVSKFMREYDYLVERPKAATLPAGAPSSDANPANYAEALARCKSQKELEAVMRQFGRL